MLAFVKKMCENIQRFSAKEQLMW